MTDAATTTEETKKTRGDGLVKAFFANDKGQDHKRVPEGVQSVILNGKPYALTSIPQGIKDQLVAFALAQRAKTYVNNHADEAKNGADVPELIDKVYSDMLDGKLYSVTAEGGKKEKAYDPSDWVEAVRLAKQKMSEKNPNEKPATPEQLEALRAKLVNLAPADRTKFVLKLSQDKVIGPLHKMIVNNRKLKEASNESSSLMDELF